MKNKLIEKRPSAIQVKETGANKLFDIINITLLCFALIVVAYPLYFVVIASFSDPYLVLRGDVLLYPKGFTFDSYARVFQNRMIWVGYSNSILYTLVGTALNVMLTMMIAYPLSRKYFCCRKLFTTILLITMYFTGGMIPTYIQVKNMGLRNTFWVMIVLGAVSTYNVIIARTFLEANIPSELEEAAAIDGCSQGRFFFQFVLPLSKAVMAVLVLYYAIAHWNDYMRGLLYLDEPNRYPLQLIIRSILIETQMAASDVANAENVDELMKMAESIKYTVIIISTIPMLMIYPFVQKHFVKGVMVGSVKG